MGGGYFDRCFHFLKHRRKWLRPKLLGIAFDCQKVEKIVSNPWDIPLYQVITEIR
jgi:5-formyltetrahydrofolate cyclo-ligase